MINKFSETDIVTFSPISKPAFFIQSPDKISFGLCVGFFQSALQYWEEILSLRILKNVLIVIAFCVGVFQELLGYCVRFIKCVFASAFKILVVIPIP